MIWRVIFDDALAADLRIVSYDLAAAACDAVYRFAENAEGKAYPVDIDACVWRIFVPGGCAIVRANAETDNLEFLRILPDDPVPTFQPLLDEPEGDEDD